MYITKEELEEFVNRFPEDETLAEQYARAAEEMIENYLGYSPEQKEYETTRYGDNGRLFELEAMPLVELESVSVNGNDIDPSLFRIKSKNYLEYNYGKGVFCSDSIYSLKYKAGFEVKTTEEAEAEQKEAETPPTADTPAEETQGTESGATEPTPVSNETVADETGQNPPKEEGTEETPQTADTPTEEPPSEEQTQEEPKKPFFAVNKVPKKIRTVAFQIASLMWESEGGNLAVSSTSYPDGGGRTFNNYKADRFLEEIKEYRLGQGGNF